MDYSKLNNISASLQDVENATSIVENKLKDQIEQIERNTAISLNDLNDKSVQKDKNGNVIIQKKNEFNINNTKHINKKIKIRFIDDMDSFVSKYIEIMKAISEEEITPEAENEYKQSLYAETEQEGFKCFVIDNKEYQNLIIDKVYDSNNNLIDESSITETPGLAVFSKESSIVANTDYYVNDFYTIDESFINIFDLKKSGSLYLFGVGNYSGESDSNDNSNEESENPKSVQEVINDLSDRIDSFAQTANDISFDDSLTHLGTQQDPIDNVQKAINMLTTAVVSGNCILSVNLKDFNGTDIASEYIGLSYVLNGNTVVLSDLSDTTPAISTDSNGIAHAVIPYGAQYTIVFNTRSNRQAIPTYTSIADTNHINIFKYYNKEADKELVIIQVMVKNANNTDLSNYSLENKEVYIDYLNSQGTVVTEAAIICYLNVRGSIQTWKESGSATVHTYSEDPIYINKGQYYRVRLQEWSPSLPSDEQELVKSENKSRLAQDYTRSFQMFYTYKKAGIFLVIEDYNDDTDLNTYTEYLCESYDDTNHTVTIIDSETDDKYILKYDASEGGIVRALSTDPTNFILWISTSNMSRVLGIGVRTSDTVNNNLEYNEYESYGYVDCSFLIPRNVSLVNKKMQDSNSVWRSLPIKYSGKAVTMFMAESQTPYSEMADYLTNQMSLKTGSLVQKPFIPSKQQSQILANNKIFIKNALLVLNNTLFNNVSYTQTTLEGNNTSFSFTNIYGTSSTPIYKISIQNVIPLYCF